jgi:hypothetical protein
MFKGHNYNLTSEDTALLVLSICVETQAAQKQTQTKYI